MRTRLQTGTTPTGNRQREKDRREKIVRIAYRHIAERGFEGLRVREVAAEAGINHATLLYYFPTKEALIQGVVDSLVQEFRTSRAPRPGDASRPRESTALEELRAEFEDLRVRLHKMPAMFVVLAELYARSRRDPAIAQILLHLEDGWRGYLITLLERGVREGLFHPDLDLVTTATAIIVQFKGIGYQQMTTSDPAQIDRLLSHLAAQTEHYLTNRR